MWIFYWGVCHKVWAVLGVEVWYNQCAWSMKGITSKIWVVSGVRPAIVIILTKRKRVLGVVFVSVFSCTIISSSLNWWRIPPYIYVHLVNHGHPNPINVVGKNPLPWTMGTSPWASWWMLEYHVTSPLLRIQPFQDQKLAIELPWLQGDYCWGVFPQTDRSFGTAKGGSSDPKTQE